MKTPAAKSPATPFANLQSLILVKLQALILDGLFCWSVVSIWAVSALPWGHGWHFGGVIWAPDGSMEALTCHSWLLAGFGTAGCPKRALKTGGARTPFLHTFATCLDGLRCLFVFFFCWPRAGLFRQILFPTTS